MSGFAAWGMSILGLAAVTTVAEILLPQGKTRKVIRSVMATVAALVIVTPLPGILKNGFDFTFEGDDIVLDENYIDFVQSQKAELIVSSALSELEKKGYEGGFTLSVELDGWSVVSCTLNFSQSGMSGEHGHINKSEIKRLVAELLGIGEEAVMVYG